MAADRTPSQDPTVHIDRRPVTVTDRLAQLGISIDLRLPGGPPPAPSARASGPRPRLDRYIVSGELGAGGMGSVLLVEDGDLGRQVAAKVMHARAQGDPQQLRRFLLEAKVAGQLEHPNIVPVYELGLTPAHELYFTMKRVTGRDLAGRIEDISRDVALGTTDYLAGIHPLLAVFGKICDAIAFAHARGVIHRDLKPANVMVGQFGEVLVLDWGLAKVLGDPGADTAATAITLAFPKLARLEDPVDDMPRTLDGDVVGTPNYMPPEQAAGRVDDIDARSDIYALGAILYHVLTFHPPFHGLGTWTVIAAAGEGRVDPPSRVRSDLPIPWELEAVVMKAMARAPADRYASALDLKGDVERYVAGGLIKAATYSPVQLVAKWVRRHRLALGATAAVLAMGVAMGAAAVVSVVRARDEAERALAETQTARATAVAARRTAEAARALELAAKQRAEGALRATSRTLADALAYKAGLALDHRRLLDAAIYVAAARAEDTHSVAALAAMAGLARSPVVLERAWDAHDGTITVVAVSRDGRRYATGDELGRVRIWDAASLARTAESAVLGFEVCALDFSRDGRHLLAADFGGAVLVLDAATGQLVTELAGPRDEVEDVRVVDVRCSPVGDVACYTSGTATIALVRLPGGEEIASIEGGEECFSSIQFSPDGKRIAAIDVGFHVWLWDASTRARVAVPADLAAEPVAAIAFAGPAELLTSTRVGIQAWDLDRGATIGGALEDDLSLYTVCGVRLGSRRGAVATAEDGTLRLYDLEAGRLVAVIGADRLAPHALAVIDDTRILAADRAGEVRAWRIAAGAIGRWSLAGLALSRPPENAPDCAAAFSPNGRFAVIARGRELAITDLVARKKLGVTTLDHPASAGAVSDDGAAVACGDDEGGLYHWDCARDHLSRLVNGEAHANVVAMSADGLRVWSGLASGAIDCWAVEGRAPRCVRTCEVGEAGIRGIGVYAPVAGATWAVVATEAEVVRLDLDAGRVAMRRPIPRRGINVLAISPDGTRFASGTTDGEIRLWDAVALTPGPVLGAHLDGITSLAWSRDGRLLASAGNEGTVAFWDPAASRLLRRLHDSTEYPDALWLDGGGRRTLMALANGDLEELGSDPAPDLRAAMRAAGLELVGADLRSLSAADFAALGR